jgi:hypothetical protein
MALNIFKKKDEKYPADEKAEILGEDELPSLPSLEELPELPEEEAPMSEEPEFPEMPMADLSRFGSGFRSAEEMAPPPMRPRAQQPLPPTRYHEEAPSFSEVSTRAPMGLVQPPHIYIKIGKYKEVLTAIQELNRNIMQTKEDLENLHALGKHEEERIRESAEVVLRIEELLKNLETTFSSPES